MLVRRISAAIVPSMDVFAATKADTRKAIDSDEQYILFSKGVADESFVGTKTKAVQPNLFTDFHDLRNRLSISDRLLMYTYNTGLQHLMVPRSLPQKFLLAWDNKGPEIFMYVVQIM